MPGRPVNDSPPSSPAVTNGDAETNPPWIIEYYDVEEEGYRHCVANPHPAEDGYSVPDIVVQALEDERYQLRSDNMTLMDDNMKVQEENKKLTEDIKALQK